MMTGPAEAVNQQLQLEESYEQRDQFLRWLYDVAYDLPGRPGELAKQIHRADSFAYSILRHRASYAWPRQIEKRQWKIDVELLMSVWAEWKAVQP